MEFFVSTGEIDMSANSITGLPNPIDRDAAANKNYVDNGGTIVKNPDGSFTAASDIYFIDFSLKNIPNPTDNKDAAIKPMWITKYLFQSLFLPCGRKKKVHSVMAIMKFRSAMVVMVLNTLMEVIV